MDANGNNMITLGSGYFSTPCSVAVDSSSGNIYVGDPGNRAIKKIVFDDAISTSPPNAVQNIGETATFNVAPSVPNGCTLTYQWQKSSTSNNWTDILGAADTRYTTGELIDTDDGTMYQCLITTVDGSGATVQQQASYPAMVMIIFPPTITIQPVNQAVEMANQ